MYPQLSTTVQRYCFFRKYANKKCILLNYDISTTISLYDKFENQTNNLTKIFTKNRLIDICIVSLRSEIFISKRGCLRTQTKNQY